LDNRYFGFGDYPTNGIFFMLNVAFRAQTLDFTSGSEKGAFSARLTAGELQ